MAKQIARHPLLAYRLRSALTQEDIARKVGVSAALICRMEKGNRVTSPKVAVAIEKKLGIPKAKLRPDIWG